MAGRGFNDPIARLLSVGTPSGHVGVSLVDVQWDHLDAPLVLEFVHGAHPKEVLPQAAILPWCLVDRSDMGFDPPTSPTHSAHFSALVNSYERM